MINANPQTYWIKSSDSEGGTGLKGSLFPYWSFTKTVIAICTLKLREEAIVDLDAPIDGTAYTLRHLLAHTSGLPDYSHLPKYARAVQAHDVPWARDEMLALALSAGLLFEPGQGWSYSNIGYMFVRDAIEAATGQSLGQLVRTMICLPLGLQSIELASTQKHFAKLHWADSASYDPKWVYHGCLIGTGADAAGVLHGLISGDLLRPESVKQMT